MQLFLPLWLLLEWDRGLSPVPSCVKAQIYSGKDTLYLL